MTKGDRKHKVWKAVRRAGKVSLASGRDSRVVLGDAYGESRIGRRVARRSR